MELTKLNFSLEKDFTKEGKPYTYLKIENIDTGEVERVFDRKIITTIKSMMLEI